jgi:ABC-type bacteriocin/lantibiotic exporter with double-glycine peptidase domain
MSRKEIESLKNRNRRVEIDKAWEVSKTRRLIIAILTYIVIVIFLYSMGVQKPWLNAIVPTIGFILSTLTLPFFKRAWLKLVYKN